MRGVNAGASLIRTERRRGAAGKKASRSSSPLTPMPFLPLAQSLGGLQNYAWLISIVLSFCTLVVWVFYAFLLHRDAQQQRLPALFIHQANGHGPVSVCLLSNLGREIVHVLGVIVVIEAGGRRYYKRLARRQAIDLKQVGHARVQDLIKQGPLPSGYFLTLGTFGEILALGDVDDDDEGAEDHPALTAIESLEVRVAAVHAAYSEPIGARRRFTVDTARPIPRVLPATLLTEVLHERRDRQRVRRWLDDWMTRPALRGSLAAE